MAFQPIRIALSGLFLLTLAACSSPGVPEAPVSTNDFVDDGDLRIAAFTENLGDLIDPANLARLTRADILLVQCDQFWGYPSFEGKMDLIRAAKPDLKIIGYFRTKAAKAYWGDYPSQTYNYDLYQASRPYWCQTTTGDTLMDWPGAVVFDYTNPAARKAMLDVFVKYQNSSSNKFDGVYWDYFNMWLWIAPAVIDMSGEPDMDADGVAHWDDPDELAAFQDAQFDWLREMQATMGPDFIQIGNGYRAATDSVFAAELDGIFYELFPNVGFSSGETFRRALDLTVSNNLFTARHWPRSSNGGPWLILSHRQPVGSYLDENGIWRPVDPGNLLRAVALLTDATSTHYDNSGYTVAAVPALEIDFGRPLGDVVITGDRYVRDFERGQVILEMGSGQYPDPFAYVFQQDGVEIEGFGEMAIDP